ncbi:MAG: cysteine desulfurase [Opitutaceae bacterium]|nr:cysteine desulfurase [Opitutaceae bacterium]
MPQSKTDSIIPFPLNVETVRHDFPILNINVDDKPLVYLDNAASTQKPQMVIDAIQHYYTSQNANIHRGVHYLSQKATDAYEEARRKTARFINADSEDEIVFVRGTTEAINLVATSWGSRYIFEGDEILISHLEHHANIVPWQMLCERVGATLKVIPIDDDGDLDLVAYEKLLTDKTRIVAIGHVSNALGTVNPIKEMIKTAHSRGIPVLVDGAQSAPHFLIDVQDLDCDFYIASAHKFYGPTGIGFLYGKAHQLDAMPPYQGGGDMIQTVTFEKTTYKKAPDRFEAGTPNIAGAIVMGTAIDYMEQIGRESIATYEQELLTYARERLQKIEGLSLIGNPKEQAGAISFALDSVHPHDIGTILDKKGIAIRAGHHCAQPLMKRLGVPATARASFAFYNTKEEIDSLGLALEKIRALFI